MSVNYYSHAHSTVEYIDKSYQSHNHYHHDISVKALDYIKYTRVHAVSIANQSYRVASQPTMGSCLSNTRSTTTVAATATTATEPPPPPPQAQARTSPTVSLHAVDLSTTPTSPIAITAHHSPSHSHNSQDDDIDNKWPIPSNMAERALSQVLGQLKHSPSMSYADANTLLSKAKLALLRLNALTPSSDVSPGLLTLARETYEQGALFAIRARKPDAFTRYVQQLQPFYELPSTRLQPNLAERNRVTGLSLLLLLTQGRYAEFHSELESLANRDAAGDVEGDKYLGYPIRLERWLMEGSYDRVWKAMKSSEVPCDEYGVFSEVRFPCATTPAALDLY